MPSNIKINSIISGTSPYQVWVCSNSTCATQYFISTITSPPYTFSVPAILVGVSSVTVKLIDAKGCVFKVNNLILNP